VRRSGAGLVKRFGFDRLVWRQAVLFDFDYLRGLARLGWSRIRGLWSRRRLSMVAESSHRSRLGFRGLEISLKAGLTLLSPGVL
jgi:hypothetical protein